MCFISFCKNVILVAFRIPLTFLKSMWPYFLIGQKTVFAVFFNFSEATADNLQDKWSFKLTVWNSSLKSNNFLFLRPHWKFSYSVNRNAKLANFFWDTLGCKDSFPDARIGLCAWEMQVKELLHYFVHFLAARFQDWPILWGHWP